MAFDFPNAPTVGQIFNATGSLNYVWDGTVWKCLLPASAELLSAEVSADPKPRKVRKAKD